MNFKSRKCEENVKKVLRYSIRRHHLGVASVAVASVLFFATGVTTVQAAEPAAGSAGAAGSTSTPGSTAESTPLNYDGKVSLIGQWTNESHEKKILKIHIRMLQIN